MGQPPRFGLVSDRQKAMLDLMEHFDETSGCSRDPQAYAVWEDRLDTMSESGRAHRRLTLSAAATEASRLCAGCPHREQCALRAAGTAYTGLAGGQVFVRGKQQPPPQPAALRPKSAEKAA